MALLEKEWFIEAPWGRLCIIAWGDCCDPPVLVCHGTNDSAVSFRPLIKLLPRKFYYIGLELPGCGKSDPMPSGLMISIYDLVYSLQTVVKHFRWMNFVYIGHSMGCSLGKTYELSYPGKISKLIELDPITFNIDVPPEKFALWYNRSFTNFFDKYSKYDNDNPNDKPKYTKQEALSRVMKRRGISREIAEALLARVTETTDGGLLRFAFDERYTSVTVPPFSKEHVKLLFTSIKTPTLTIIADESKNTGKYNSCTYLLSESPSWPNYRVREVEGNHDVHIIHPERVAPFLVQFLLNGLSGLDNRAKL